MFTEQEKKDIELWRDKKDNTKYEVIWMQKFKNRILKSQNKPQEKLKCFCSSSDRRAYKPLFYTFWDSYNDTNRTDNTTENAAS